MPKGINPCPRCGKKKRIAFQQVTLDTWTCKCNKCGFCVGECNSKEEATAIWNSLVIQDDFTRIYRERNWLAKQLSYNCSPDNRLSYYEWLAIAKKYVGMEEKSFKIYSALVPCHLTANSSAIEHKI